MFSDGLLPSVESSIEIQSGGVVTINGVVVSGEDISEDIRDRLIELQNILTDSTAPLSQDALLAGGSFQLNNQLNNQLNSPTSQEAAVISFDGLSTEAGVDDALQSFITGESQPLALESAAA